MSLERAKVGTGITIYPTSVKENEVYACTHFAVARRIRGACDPAVQDAVTAALKDQG